MGNKAFSYHSISLVVQASAIIALLIGWCIFNPNADPDIQVIVLITGMLGALVSAMVGLGSSPDTGKNEQISRVACLHPIGFIAYTCIPTLVGGICAVGLTVLFSSGILAGSLFPEWECVGGKGACTTFRAVIDGFSPVGAENYMKSIAWGAIAGVSGRL